MSSVKAAEIVIVTYKAEKYGFGSLSAWFNKRGNMMEVDCILLYGIRIDIPQIRSLWPKTPETICCLKRLSTTR